MLEEKAKEEVEGDEQEKTFQMKFEELSQGFFLTTCNFFGI